MSRKSRTRKSRTGDAQSVARPRPKPGPGAVYVEELVSAKTGRELRYRNVGEHPLTLAHARGRLSNEQFAAGDELRKLCELRHASGRDSTVFVPGAGVCTDIPYTQTQMDAIRRIGRIREQLKKRDWIILEKFCGEGWPMAEAVRAATVCHRSGVLQRIQEALDELIETRCCRRD
ncbi:MAG TPA: hypothetical protein VII49_01740 [Rhizomicrobium sp.]